MHKILFILRKSTFNCFLKCRSSKNNNGNQIYDSLLIVILLNLNTLDTSLFEIVFKLSKIMNPPGCSSIFKSLQISQLSLLAVEVRFQSFVSRKDGFTWEDGVRGLVSSGSRWESLELLCKVGFLLASNSSDSNSLSNPSSARSSARLSKEGVVFKRKSPLWRRRSFRKNFFLSRWCSLQSKSCRERTWVWWLSWG